MIYLSLLASKRSNPFPTNEKLFFAAFVVNVRKCFRLREFLVPSYVVRKRLLSLTSPSPWTSAFSNFSKT